MKKFKTLNEHEIKINKYKNTLLEILFILFVFDTCFNFKNRRQIFTKRKKIAYFNVLYFVFYILNLIIFNEIIL